MKYKQNDIIKNEYGKRKVLGVCGEVCFVSEADDFYEANNNVYTQINLDKNHYTLDQSEWTPEWSEKYYFADLDLNEVNCGLWHNDIIDLHRKSLNLIFPYTEEGKKQAEARLLEVVNKLK